MVDDRSYIESPMKSAVKVRTLRTENQKRTKENKQPTKKPIKAKATSKKQQSKKPVNAGPENKVEERVTEITKIIEKVDPPAPRRSARTRKKPDRYTA